MAFRNGAISINGAPFDVQMIGDGQADEDRGQWMVRETAGAGSRTLKINPFVQGRLALNLSDPGLAAHCRAEAADAWECTVPAGHYMMLSRGVTIAYAESVEAVPANMAEVRPTVMCSVPRLYEKMHARILETVAAEPRVRQRVFRWAVGVGLQAFRHRVGKTRPPARLRRRVIG